MTTNINNSPEYACRTCAKQECGCKDTECQLPCHFYTEQAEQEPVCKRCNGTKIVPDGKMYSVDGFQLEVPIECVKDCPDCTAPVRTKDLTDDEINELWLTHGQGQMMYIHEKFARAVIAAYKEKNK